ncbi:unnamed protein product [Caenorhabditis brenneri]
MSPQRRRNKVRHPQAHQNLETILIDLLIAVLPQINQRKTLFQTGGCLTMLSFVNQHYAKVKAANVEMPTGDEAKMEPKYLFSD